MSIWKPHETTWSLIQVTNYTQYRSFTKYNCTIRDDYNLADLSITCGTPCTKWWIPSESYFCGSGNCREWPFCKIHSYEAFYCPGSMVMVMKASIVLYCIKVGPFWSKLSDLWCILVLKTTEISDFLSHNFLKNQCCSWYVKAQLCLPIWL